MPQHSSTSPANAPIPFQPGTSLRLRIPLDVQLSPDGTRVAFILSEFVPERAKARSRLWTVDVATGEAAALCPAPEGDDACPRWSPDGTRLVFLSSRENAKAEKQLYLATVRGLGQAEVTRVCSMPNGVLQVAWAPDGQRLAFTSLEGPEPARDPFIPRPGRHRRVWTVRVGSDSPEPVTPAAVTVWEFAWSPEGSQLAVFFSVGPDETDYYRGQVGTVSAHGGNITQLTHLDRQAAALAWSPDGAQLAYIAGEWSDRGLVGGDVHTVAVAGGEPRNLTPGVELSPALIRWQADGQRLLYVAWEGTAHQVGWLGAEGGALTPLARDVVIGEAHWPKISSSAALDAFACTRSIAGQHPYEVYHGAIGPDGITWRRLTHLNAALEESTLTAPTQLLRFEGAGGWEIEALYNPPVTPPAAGKPPLVLNVHGGPTSAWADSWHGGYLTQLLCGAGFAVLRVNPRGSIGRGVAFADAVLGDMGGKDFEDLLAGVDEAVRLELADGDRVGIIGWSYGGFMTAWAVSQTTRFKAAMMGAGICDYHSFHAQTNVPDWDMRFLKAIPNENPEIYREKSALTYAARIQTPTLILHGEQDDCVPVNQAYAFHRALTERGVPVELVIYPREGHGPAEKDHIQDLEARVVGWLGRYLKGVALGPAVGGALLATSPDTIWWGGALARALTGAGFLRLGHRLPDPLLQAQRSPPHAVTVADPS